MCFEASVSRPHRLHRTEIGKIEQGDRGAGPQTLVILVDGLGVRLDELLDGLDVPMERKPPSDAEASGGAGV